MTKQVKTATETVAPVVNGNNSRTNLFMSVKTFDKDGKTVGERIVDLFHFGTRNWLSGHIWWAMHNGHCVETNVATEAETDAYLASAKEALAAKYNGTAEAASA